MSRMSELHGDLSTIHAILLGQRQLLEKCKIGLYMQGANDFCVVRGQIETIDNLLLEIEAAGVVWPDNVVELHA